MGKSLLIILLLIVTGVALYFGYQLYGQKLDSFISEPSSGNETATPSPPKNLEIYRVPQNINPEGRIELETVKEWNGELSREIKYSSKTAPWILNGGAIRTSNIAARYDVTVWKEIAPGVRMSAHGLGETIGAGLVIQEAGDFIIQVDAVGCKWWLKVGAEN